MAKVIARKMSIADHCRRVEKAITIPDKEHLSPTVAISIGDARTMVVSIDLIPSLDVRDVEKLTYPEIKSLVLRRAIKELYDQFGEKPRLGHHPSPMPAGGRAGQVDG